MSDSGAELTVLGLTDMGRCSSCRRLVTQRRVLTHGHCKCGGVRLNPATFLDESDLLEIEEDYGWNVRITGVGEFNVATGLLQGRTGTPQPGGTCVYEVSESRLHSREGHAKHQERQRAHDHLGFKSWWVGSGFATRFPRGPGAFNDFIRSLRKPQFFFSSKHEHR